MAGRGVHDRLVDVRGDSKDRAAGTRREKAAQTRRRIMDAAQALFTERGYAATSIERIAKSAGVAVQTVYFVFGNKISILKALLDVSVAGDDAPIPTLERPWVTQAVAAEPADQLRLQARAAREIAERASPVLQALRGAASADGEAAELWTENRRQLRAVQHHLMLALADKDGLRSDLDVETATDITYAVVGSDLYHVLVTEQGWPPERWESFAAQLLAQQLLP
ncbi:TetR/AcrR family transcriptional regulator [Streptomyces sp. NPDC059193]|uniref:TetR/AcrR family transcriptional regulator n=1 Tax=Streptomyces sp. NPDC059193 TaxID=3346763 RepID=UPI00368C87F6